MEYNLVSELRRVYSTKDFAPSRQTGNPTAWLKAQEVAGRKREGFLVG
ncbi:MAG: hypothetical protein IPH39_15265 [Sulfuritalea sp.]|nr:hypothetical protein [Sulfuritalea sp.]